MIPDWAGYCRFRDAFREVMDERYYTLEWLDDQVLRGLVQFWRTDDAAIIAEVRNYPTGNRDIHGLIAAGNLQSIIEVLIPRAEEFGRAHGCIAAVIESREGWSKALRPYGYQTFQVTVRKELPDGA